MTPFSHHTKIARLALTAVATVAATIGMAATAHADAPVNLKVNDTIRAELLAAGAALNGLPASDFVGLMPGLTYYAYDRCR